MAVTAKERDSRSSRKKRTPNILEQLIAGCDAERVAVQFVDGRSLEGALLFNPIKRSGKLINVEQEFSLDFDPLEVKEIRIVLARAPSAALERIEVPVVAARVVDSSSSDEDDDD